MASKGCVWLVSQYTPAPGDAWRPMRSQYLSQSLLERGYTVLQWTANFSHQTKAFRAAPWEEREIEPGWTLRFVPTTAYRRNVGAARLASERRFAHNFLQRAKGESAPACVVVIEPPAILGVAALKAARRFHAPVVSDVMDLWPEFFHRVLPARARSAGRAVFAAQYARRRRLWQRVDGLVAGSHSYVDHALRIVPELRDRPHDCVYNSLALDFVRERLTNPSEILGARLPAKAEGETWFGYGGNLGLGYEIPTLLRAAALLRERGSPARFVMAGAGPFAPEVQAAAEKPDSNITFLGHVHPDDLFPMLGRCDAGLLTYAGDSTVAMPDKFYDYAFSGLPILNSLHGEVHDLIERLGIGVNFVPGDPVAMADAVDGLARDPARRAAMATRLADSAPTWDAPTHYGRFVDLIDETIRRKAQSA